MALLKSVATVGGYTMMSRVLGFVRDILIAAFMGAGPVADAFFVAFRLPNLFRRLFAEGAFNAAFVPLFAGRLETDGLAAAKRFAGQALAALVAILLPLTVAAEIAMPWLVPALAPGFLGDPVRYGMAVEMTRLTFPYLMFMALTALLGAMLNSLHRFAAAAAAPIVLNVVLIAAIAGLGGVLETPGHALSWGVAAAGVAQFLLLVVACRRNDALIELPVPRLTPDMRRLWALTAPGVMSAGVTQINIWVGTILASLLPGGAISYLYYADRVNQLPLGVVGVAVGVALLPLLTRQLRAGQADAAHDSQNRAVELSLLLTLPATAALLVIAEPIVAVLFERGAFGPTDSAATADALAAFAAGLPAYVLIKALSPGFFAREDTVTPMKIAVASLIANSLLSAILMWPFGHVGIALATAIAAWLNAGSLWWLLHRRGLFPLDPGFRKRVPRIVVSSALLGLALGGAAHGMGDILAGPPAHRMAGLAVLVLGGLGVYVALALSTGAADRRELRAWLRRKAV